MWLLNPYRFAAQQPWTPAAITTALWLDAADAGTITQSSGLVDQINDKKGNGRDFTASSTIRPTYTANALNGLSALTFGGSQWLTSVSASSAWNFLHNSTGATIYMLLKIGTSSDPNAIYGLMGTSGGSNANIGVYNAYDDRASLSRNNATNSAVGMGNTSTPVSQSIVNNALTPNSFILFQQVYDNSNSTAINRNIVYVNAGSAIQANTGTATPSSSNASFTLQIGTVGNNASPAVMTLGETVIVSGVASNSVSQRIEGYLAHKWGLTANLPADHPYKTVPPYLIYDIDAERYIAAVEAADGQTLETGVKDAINTFVIGCKADGIWTAIKASCILAGARTLAGALVPLVGTAPTNFNFVAGDYNRKTGLLGNGSTKYLNSNRNNNADPQNSNHNAVYATQITSAGAYMSVRGAAASDTGANAMGVGPFFRNRTATASTHASTATGLIAHARSSSSSYTVRFAGSNTSVASNSETPLGINLFVFARNTNGTPEFYGNARLAFYSIGESLNLALLDARVTTLINAISAAIP
jgi:hypothetical protein